MKPYVLYKIHDNRDYDMLRNIVRYMYAKNIADMWPKMIIERCFSSYMIILPAIVINGYTIQGINNIIDYYEKSIEFEKMNPNYTISQKSTHKNIFK